MSNRLPQALTLTILPALLCCGPAHRPVQAQSPVLVTAVVSGANSAPYAYGSYQIQLVDSSGNPVTNTTPPTSQVSGNLTAGGSLSVSLYPNPTFLPPPGATGTQWKFTICSANPASASSPSSPLPIYMTTQVCFSAPATVAAAVDLTATLSGAAPPVYYFNSSTGVLYGQASQSSTLLTTANTWNRQQTFNQGILLSNPATLQASNSAGTPGDLAYVDVSNNWYYGDVNNVFGGTGYVYYAGSPSLTFTSGAVTFNRPPILSSFVLNGSQSILGVNGTGTLIQMSDGTGSAGNCPQYSSDGKTLTNSGAPCGGGAGGGVTSINSATGAMTFNGAVTQSGNTFTFTTGNNTIKCDVTIPSATVPAYNSSNPNSACFPAYPAAPAQITTCSGFTSAAAIQVTAQSEYSITSGWSPVYTPVTPIVWADSTANVIDYRLCNTNAAGVTTGAFGARLVITP